MITIMDNSLPVYRQKYNKKKWQRQMECYTNLITANEMALLNSSELVEYCKRVFRDCSKKPTKFKDFCSVRNHLLTYLCQDIGFRTANMALKEFDKANKVEGCT